MPDALSDSARARRAPSSPSGSTERPPNAEARASDDRGAPPDAEAPPDLPYREELRRKGLHLLALVLPLGAALLGKPRALYVLVPAALLAFTCDVLRSHSRRFAQLIRRVFGGMMRPDEWAVDASGLAFGVRVNGATWTLVTMALLTLLFPLPVAVTAFSLFMIGDAAAALVGRRYGRTHWGDGPRTVEGSVAFVVAAGLAAAPLAAAGYVSAPWWAVALAVFVAAGSEALPRPLNDNLRVPFLAALVLYLLR